MEIVEGKSIWGTELKRADLKDKKYIKCRFIGCSGINNIYNTHFLDCHFLDCERIYVESASSVSFVFCTFNNTGLIVDCGGNE